MNEKNNKITRLMCILMTLSLLCISFSTVFHQPITADENNQTISTMSYLPPIEVEKLVWDGSAFVDSAIVNEGDIVQFQISIYNPIDNYEVHWSGIIYDILPCNLEYILGSATLPLEYHPSINPEQYYTVNNTVVWHVDKESPILPHQYFNFTYNATAICCGLDYLENNLTVSPSKIINVCNPADIIYNNGSLDVSDSALIKVICDPEPDITIIKNVKDGGCWLDSTTIYEGDDVEFRLLIENTGFMNLTSVHVVDTLPSILSYNYDANITPISADDHEIVWEFITLNIGETIEITFTAHADAVGEVDNFCVVTTCQGVGDSDDAHIMVSGMIIEKKVWSSYYSSWVDEVDASIGDTLRFRITVNYIGNGSYTLYNIRIRDELPECLIYANDAVPIQTAISSDGKTIWWNLSLHVSAGGQTSVEFDALVSEISGCGPCVNHAIVSAQECSGHFFIKEDNATVNADCPLCADAGGPYYGEIGENIYIEGSATGGSPPYAYYWDLDDDGFYDDYVGSSFSYNWGDDGTYLISLKVIDDDHRNDIDSASVIINPPDNDAPNKPSKPNGETNGEPDQVYSYTTSTTDLDDDLIKYGWDWNGDNVVDEWTGFYSSGITISTAHAWSSSGYYSVKVKAEDEHGAQSDFSIILSVEIADNSAPSKPILSGPTSGKAGVSYSYSAYANDPDGDQLYYYFDWGDGTNSGWVGPFSSGQTASGSHVWNSKGSYTLKVQVKDAGGLESVWSDPFSVSMPKIKNGIYLPFYDFIEWILQIFPFLSFFFS